MPLLNETAWKGVYRSGEDNVFKDLYAPALACAVQYDRAVGFFGAQALVENIKGLSGLIKNDGRMRLVIGHPLEEGEFEAVRKGYRLRSIIDSLDSHLEEVLKNVNEFGKERLSLLSYLIAQNRLEIKYAFRKNGMYHEKVGIIYDQEGNKLVFHGSANETVYGLSSNFNAESISVFKSWDKHSFSLYGKEYIDGFNRLWEGRTLNTVTVDVPSETYDRFRKLISSNDLYENKFFIKEQDNEQQYYSDFFSAQKNFNKPVIPEKLGGQDFNIREHQISAIRAWKAHQYRGILKLSTGSGKTITSIYAAAKLYEARAAKSKRTVVIVSVPYKELAEQWVLNLKLFNIYPIKCWESRSRWFDDLKTEVLDLTMGVIDFIAVVVVNRTMESESFKACISQLDANDIVFIGDECHNHGSKNTSEALPDAYYRMGLSATPFRSDNDEIDSPFPNFAKQNIEAYYGGVVSEYSLGDAINDRVLCEYEYHIVPVYLTIEEQEEYEFLSKEISKLLSTGTDGKKVTNSNQLTMLCGRRSRLLGSAKNKLVELRKLVQKIPKSERKHSLFYCGEGRFSVFEQDNDPEFDGKIIERVSEILNEEGWHSSRFTSEEGRSERRSIMKNFEEGSIDALVSMKVLDEGVDVPVCDKAFILASTRNPRQYVQRRGRVLRIHKDKELALIYDFVVLPSERSPALDRLIEAELERIDDFMLLAINRNQVEKEVNSLALRTLQ